MHFRCYDYELPCMLRLKNKLRAVIVVYDDDESIASKAATTLTQRGYDNVFMLSGELPQMLKSLLRCCLLAPQGALGGVKF